MAVRASRFGNARYFVSGAYSRVDVRPSAAGFLASNNLIVMGLSEGGEPHTPLEFYNLSEARRALKGGALYDAMQFAFQPGAGFVPLRVFALRVNRGTQSSLSMVEGTNSQITLTSRDYGVRENRIRAILTTPAGTTATRSITIQSGDVEETFENITKPVFTVQLRTGGNTDRAVVPAGVVKIARIRFSLTP